MIGKNLLRLWRRMGFCFLLIPILLLFIGCNSTPERDFTPITLVPTPITSELPDGVKMARDATMSYLTAEYDLQLPINSANWSIEYNLVDDLVGAGAYRLTADSCVVTISNPLMAPDLINYFVVLDDAVAGVHWEGYVDCNGQVLPAGSSEDKLTANVLDTINIVKMADLHKTVGIEVCKLDCATYTPRYTIGSRELIAALVAALDTDIPLSPHAPCPAVYHLRFILADGQHYDFGYTCQMMTPTFLRGSQVFWHDQDAIAPDAFNELMVPLIAPAPFNASQG